MAVRPSDRDSLTLPFLEAADDEDARERLGELLVGHASPLIRQIVGRQLLSWGGPAARTREVLRGHPVVVRRAAPSHVRGAAAAFVMAVATMADGERLSMLPAPPSRTVRYRTAERARLDEQAGLVSVSD
jgi:hypothetical protein